MLIKMAKINEFWIITSGRGMLDSGKKVGNIQVKSKGKDIDVIKEKAYQQLKMQTINPYIFDLELIKEN